MKLKISAKSDQNACPVNENGFLRVNTPYGALFLLCEGHGKDGTGQLAMNSTLKVFPEFLGLAHDMGLSTKDGLIFAFNELNKKKLLLVSKKNKDSIPFGVSIVLALATEHTLIIGKTGYCSCYWINRTPGEPFGIEKFPTNTPPIGFSSHLDIALASTDNPPWDKGGLVFCSSSLRKFVNLDSLTRLIAKAPQWENLAKNVIQLAKLQGSTNNLAVLAVYVENSRIGNQPLPTQLTDPQTPKTTTGKGTTGNASTGNKPNPSRIKNRVFNFALLRVFILIFSLGFTLIHLSRTIHISDYKPDNPNSASTKHQKTLATEVENSDLYHWDVAPCPQPIGNFARSTLHGIFNPLRRQEPSSSKINEDLYFEKVKQSFGADLDRNLAWIPYLEKLATSLAAEYQYPTPKIHVVSKNDINAYALPDNHILIFEGLLNLIENEAQLVFILAHEIAHLKAGHTFTQFPTQVLNEDLANLLNNMANHAFGPEQEEEADRMAVNKSYAIGYSAFQSIRILELIDDKERSTQTNSTTRNNEVSAMDLILREAEAAFSTHPVLERRICLLKNRLIQLKISDKRTEYYIGKTNLLIKIPKNEHTF